MWCTGLPVRHSLPNPIVVCTCSLSSVIIKLSYMFSHWFRPHVGLAIHANLRGWVNCTQFQQNLLISGHVLIYIDNYWQPLTSAAPRVRHPESPFSLLPLFVSSASPRFHKRALQNVTSTPVDAQKCCLLPLDKREADTEASTDRSGNCWVREIQNIARVQNCPEWQGLTIKGR